MSDPNCIFCKIIAGEIPCHKIYEDNDTLAFLDIGPLSEGHCLVIPKEHYQTIDEMPDELAGKCMSVVSKLSKVLKDAIGMTAWNVLQNNGSIAGQAVGHVHFHIIPRSSEDGLGYRWNSGELSTDDAKRLIDTITQKLS